MTIGELKGRIREMRAEADARKTDTGWVAARTRRELEKTGHYFARRIESGRVTIAYVDIEEERGSSYAHVNLTGLRDIGDAFVEKYEFFGPIDLDLIFLRETGANSAPEE